jgi:hypothetical protein
MNDVDSDKWFRWVYFPMMRETCGQSTQYARITTGNQGQINQCGTKVLSTDKICAIAPVINTDFDEPLVQVVVRESTLRRCRQDP